MFLINKQISWTLKNWSYLRRIDQKHEIRSANGLINVEYFFTRLGI